MLSEAQYGNIRLRIVKDKEAAAEHFARTMVDAIQANNHLNTPTRLIMPVGPRGQYRSSSRDAASSSSTCRACTCSTWTSMSAMTGTISPRATH